MRLGLFLGDFRTTSPTAAPIGPALGEVARRAEEAGLASLWLNDHFFQIPAFGGPDDPVPEPYAVLAYVAAVTRTLELGTLTTGATYRPPGLLLKTVATLDRLSGGRAWLGIGPPWNEAEQRAMGLPVMPWPERFARLEEILRLARQLWAGDPSPFLGEHYRLEDPRLCPPPVRRPPILVGGAHERRVLQLVAAYGDACNLFEDEERPDGAALLQFKLGVLRRNCEKIGRDPAEIVVTTFGRLTVAGADRGRVADRFARLADLGVQHAIVGPDDVSEAGLELLAHVAAAVGQPAAAPERTG